MELQGALDIDWQHCDQLKPLPPCHLLLVSRCITYSVFGLEIQEYLKEAAMLRWLGYILTLFGIGAGGILLMLTIARKDTLDARGTLLAICITCLVIGLALLYVLGEYPFTTGTASGVR